MESDFTYKVWTRRSPHLRLSGEVSGEYNTQPANGLKGLNAPALNLTLFRRTMLDKERLESIDDIKKLFPGIPVFQMPADVEALADYLIALRRPDPKTVDEIMREYGDGTSQGDL